MIISQVLTGFGASAYLALFFCIAYHLLNHNGASNPIDKRLLAVIWERRKSRPSKKWIEALESAILSLSDQQVVTGLAILVAGYSQLNCGLAVYHWQITVDLAWFSSITHLTTLTCLQHYLCERLALKVLRVISMLVIGVMLASALGATGYMSSENIDVAFPAQCLYQPRFMSWYLAGSSDNQFSTYDFFYVLVSVPFLCGSYLNRTVRLFPGVFRFPSRLRVRSFKAILRGWLGRLAKAKALRSYVRPLSIPQTPKAPSHGIAQRFIYIILYKLLLSLYFLLEAIADLWGSLLWEVIRGSDDNLKIDIC